MLLKRLYKRCNHAVEEIILKMQSCSWRDYIKDTIMLLKRLY